MFLSIFNSFVGFHLIDIVMLQDLPSRKGFLPSFIGYKFFCPPTLKPAVAICASVSFLSFHSVQPVVLPSSEDVMHVEIFTPTGCSGTNFPRYRFTNEYSGSLPGSTKSVRSFDALSDVNFACRVAGDFNIHHHAVDTLRVVSRSEEKASTPYFGLAFDLAYSLRNTPGKSTRFPRLGPLRPSAMDLSFPNPLIYTAF